MIHVTINGAEYIFNCAPNERLLDVLRKKLLLTGTKEGCGEGECGACSVLIDGKLANSCLVPMGSVADAKIVTIDGFRGTQKYQVLAGAFADAGAVQCGFCTPGMILAAQALLEQNPAPVEQKVRVALSGNICRCTGYNMIVEAVLMAAKRGKGLW